MNAQEKIESQIKCVLDAVTATAEPLGKIAKLYFDGYKKAGFTEDQAFQLTLDAIKRTSV
jgi:hypothetical protein